MHFRVNKDFCLWLVPGSDGRVRKVRFTLARALLLFGFSAAVLAGFLYIAGDYARVQALRAKHYFFLKQVAAERDNLRDTKEQLEGKLGNLETAQAKAAAYESRVRERLEELASIINSAKLKGLVESSGEPALDDHGDQHASGSALPGSKTGGIGGSERGGLGGAEIDCFGKGVDRCAGRGEVLSQGGELFPFGRITDTSPKGDVLESLEKYIALVRTLPLGLPVGSGEIRSGFGVRVSPFGGGIKMHEGLDLAFDYGSPVYATGDGVVGEVGYTGTYGLLIDVAHSDRISTRYAHLSRSVVKNGQFVKKGTLLGYSGSSGRSTGPHLHYEIRVYGQPVNPMRFVNLATELSLLL